MKRVTVLVSRTEYGFVEVEVEDNAPRAGIYAKALEQEANGYAHWDDWDTHVTGIASEVHIEEDKNE